MTDYRERLFEELRLRSPLGPILEVGPKDYADTRRLRTLGQALTTIDLNPPPVLIPGVTHLTGNLMYDGLLKPEAYATIWCTGVLYHNPEQLRLIRMLRDLLTPGGLLVLESATSRRYRKQNVVEVLYPPSEATKRKYHVSLNVTHLPSAKAIESWLLMVGFVNLLRSRCHGWLLGRDRVAFIARKPSLLLKPSRYYDHYAPGEAR